jgi:hypothetical protein
LFDILINDFDFRFGPLEDGPSHMGIHLNMDSNLVMFLCIDHGGDVEDIISHLSLLGFEEVAEFEQAHHLAGAVVELGQDYALVLEQLPIVVVLFFAQIFVLGHVLIILFDVVVGDIAIGEEILNFEGIKFFLILDDLHGSSFSFFCDECGWGSFLKDAYLWDHELDLSGELIHEIELIKKRNKKFLFFSLGQLRLMVGE